MKEDKENIYIEILSNWRIGLFILVVIIALVVKYNPSKAMTHIVCQGSNCQIKDYKDSGALLHFSQMPIDECKSFEVEGKEQKALNFFDALNDYIYQLSWRSDVRDVEKHENKYIKYTIACQPQQGESYPLFKTYIRNKSKAYSFASTLTRELSKENPSVDMKFQEKE